MSAAIEQLNEIEAKAIELLEQVQEPIVEGVRNAAEWAEENLPEIKVPNLDRFGTVDEYVDFAFKAVDAVVKNQKAFVGELVTATAPVRAKFVDADAKPVKPVKSAKPAAKAA